MPFNEALFWFGLTAFGTGLFVLLDEKVKRLYSVGLTVLGVLGCAYSVYHHDHPESPTVHAWEILLVLTWALLGYVIYLRNSPKQHRKEQTENCQQFTGIFNPLQVEAFAIAKDLRDFLDEIGPAPTQPLHNPGEGVEDYLKRLHVEGQEEKQVKWRAKLMHGYANRKFGERITALMHRAGEEVEYPAYVPNYAESAPFTAEDVRKHAQEMEMVALFINRKVRGEVNLLK